MKTSVSLGLVGALALAATTAISAQALPPRPRITTDISNAQVVALPGNVLPQVRRANDLGVAPDSLPLNRMLLLLKRSPQQELALQQLLVAQQTPGSPQYHQWLTPQQFGQQFGPATADIQTASNWLTAQGFTVTHVAAGGNVIEFSGTAGTVAASFQTNIHRYSLRGVSHWANSSNPTIPAALAPVVAGVVSLNNFLKPAGHMTGQGHGTVPPPGQVSPSFTYSNGSGVHHALVPGDFALLYDANPLYNASPAINGQGETIAIVGRSDVDPNDISDFRQLFVPGNPANLPHFIVNGPDPGKVDGDQQEADLDLEWSGAVAPNATIDFVVSASTDTTDGVDLSAEYIVEYNLATVMSTSFSACEAQLGTAENGFINSLYEEAAAQGITVVDSSGDSGAAGCDPNDGSETAAQYGLAVGGLSTTPYDVAVGGTQLNEGSNSAAYWNATNNGTNYASVLGPIPETGWNESCVNTPCNSSGPLSSSGGGASVVYTTKPSWQSGVTGMPADGVRDVPDLSFSSAGHDGYVVCTGRDCQVQKGSFGFDVFGGTSASAPSFAGVMALVNQKMGAAQGVANYTLYALGRSENWGQCNSATGAAASCVFLDTTVGNNSVPCQIGSTGCGSTGTLTGFSAGVGYDQVTGLGSINVANLVNNWHSATAALASTTSLSLSPTTITHGQPVNVRATVTQKSGAIGPTGDVAFLAQTGGNGVGVDFGTLTLGGSTCGTTGCVAGAENGLPGGTYPVVARYGGDASFLPSVSNAVNVTVSPEASITQIYPVEFTSQGESQVNQIYYGDYLYLDAFVQGAAGASNLAGCQAGTSACINDGIPVGSVTFSNNGTPLALPGLSSTLALNTEGEATFPNGVTNLAPGSYSLSGAFTPSTTDPNGAASFNPSTSSAVPLTVLPAPTTTAITATVSGSSLNITAQVNTLGYGAAPSGTLAFFSGGTQVGSATLGGAFTDPATGYTYASIRSTIASIPNGQDSITAQFAGDANYTASTSPAVIVTVGTTGGGFTLSAAQTSATVNPGTTATYTLTLSPNNGFNGSVALSCTGGPATAPCVFTPASLTLSGTASQTSTLTLAIPATSVIAAPVGKSDRSPWPWVFALMGLLALAAGICLADKRRRLSWALPAGLALMALTAVACGGSSSGSNAVSTPSSNYTISITASSGTVTATQSVTLTVD